MHGVPIETAVLPAGWEQRVIVVQNANTRQKAGLCVEGHDLAASKLSAFREKDRAFVRVLLAKRMVAADQLTNRLRQLPLDAERIRRLVTWVETTEREFSR